MKKIVQIVLVLILAFALVGCNRERENETPTATRVTISATGAQDKVQIGTTKQFSYKVVPANAAKDGVTWSVDNTQLATISETGLFTAGNQAGKVFITIELTSNGEKITAKKGITITTEAVVEYPNLGEYTIKIAQAEIAIGETDPNSPIDDKAKYGYYAGADRAARQEAWKFVEDEFNCTIDVVAYPSDAPWGPSRWTYIINQAIAGTPDYDFYTIPDAQVPGLSSANAILDLTDWYNSYGNDFMTTISKTAGTYKGKLYTINWNEANVYNILGYNVGLWEDIHEYDATIKEPARMFLDEQWNVTNFVAYCKKCQDALNSKFGADSGYHVLSGWPTYYFVGMVDRNGEGVADVAKKQVHILNEDATNAANALKEIFEYGAFDEKFSVDQGVVSWTNGKSLFNTGDLWFIGANQGRWDSDMWGAGEATRYGYVPFPAPDGMEGLENIYTGITSEACWVMAAGREASYASYGEECTPENIYLAMVTYWLKTREFYRGGDDYDIELAFHNTAAAKFGTQDAIEAFVKVSMKLESDAFYDPMTSNSNTVCYTSGSDFDINLRKFVLGTGAATWAEAVGGLQETLNESITKAFGG